MACRGRVQKGGRKTVSHPKYWRGSVKNNLSRINYELGEENKLPKTEEEAYKLYHRWLSSLAERGHVVDEWDS